MAQKKEKPAPADGTGTGFTNIELSYINIIPESIAEVKYKFNVGKRGYKAKPTDGQGKVSNETRIAECKRELTIAEVLWYATAGHTLTAGHQDGGKGDDWRGTNCLILDADNDTSDKWQKLKTIKHLNAHGIPVPAGYETFSSKPEHEKYRMFVPLTETETDRERVKKALIGIHSIFPVEHYADENNKPQTRSNIDRSCNFVNCLYYGTDKPPFYTGQGEALDIQVALKLYEAWIAANPPPPPPPPYKPPAGGHIGSFELQREVQAFNLDGFVQATNNVKRVLKTTWGVRYDPCPFCNDNGCFYIDSTKTPQVFYCFACQLKGNILNYIEHKYGQRDIQKSANGNNYNRAAVEYFKYQICGVRPEDEKREWYEHCEQERQAQQPPPHTDNDAPPNDHNGQNEPPPPNPEDDIAEWEDIHYNTLLKTDWGSINWYIENIIHDGLTVIASMPKLGKSILAMNMCIAIASGKAFWGMQTKKSRVAYLALEDTNRRLKDRAWKMSPKGTDFEKCDLHLVTATRNLEDGLLVQLDMFMKRYPDTGVVVIDILQRVRGGVNRGGKNAYEFDIYEMQKIKAAADKHKISIICIHHDSKMKPSQSVVDGFSGSRGIVGTADCLLAAFAVAENSKQAKLFVKTREAESQQYLMEHGDPDRLEWVLVEKQDFNENTAGQTGYTTGGRKPTKQSQCADWLADLLDRIGWIKITDAVNLGLLQGYDKKTVERAKRSLGYVLTARRGEKGIDRYWYIDGHEVPTDPDELLNRQWVEMEDEDIGDIFPQSSPEQIEL